MQRLLEGRRLLEGDAYFNVDIQRCSTYKRAALIWGQALIRGNTVLNKIDEYEGKHFGESPLEKKEIYKILGA